MSSSSKKVIQGELEVDFESTSLIVWYYVESKELDERSGTLQVLTFLLSYFLEKINCIHKRPS